MLQLAVTETIRSLGWTAEMEVIGDGWRADVLAQSPDGELARSIAFEIQLSPQSGAETEDRIARLSASGNEVVWIVRRRPTWLRQHPAWLLGKHEDDTNAVVDGIWTWSTKLGNVVQGKPATLTQAIEPLLEGRMHWHPDLRTRLRTLAPSRRRGSDAQPGGWCLVKSWHHLSRRQLESEALERDRQRILADIVHRAAQPGERTRRPTPLPTTSADGRSATDRLRDHNREASTKAIMERCRALNWTCDIRPPHIGSYWGAVVIVEGTLIIVEPTGARNGAWPGALIINQRGELPGCDDVSVTTIDEWLNQPRLGQCDPSVVDVYAQRFQSATKSAGAPRQLGLPLGHPKSA